MLTLVVQGAELYDEVNNEFIPPKTFVLQLEHSLVSLSKWESKWHKPFLTKTSKTTEESIDYIRCMTITKNVPPNVYENISDENMQAIEAYIDAPMTATTFRDIEQKKTNRRIITAEIIYYWMICANIPFECQKWHLNRLLTLINVCNIESKPPKKMSKREIFAENRRLNELRKAQFKTNG